MAHSIGPIQRISPPFLLTSPPPFTPPTGEGPNPTAPPDRGTAAGHGRGELSEVVGLWRDLGAGGHRHSNGASKDATLGSPGLTRNI